MPLVKVQENTVYCDSSMIAKKFGVKHAYVINNCDKLLCDLGKIKGGHYRPLIIREEREYRGNAFTAYLMDRNFFSLLCMRFRGDKALEWQIKFNDAFYAMELSLRTTSPILDELNQMAKLAEVAKDKASNAGRDLANYKKVGPENKRLMEEAFKKVQLTLF